jgi:HD-GYP domain-containing protein (c-di-GMP phosphodiesterase class II)
MHASKDDAYLELLSGVAPVYDVGLLSVPRGILMKPDKLDAEEKSVMQAHTTIGSEVLMRAAGKLAAELPGLPIAAEVARSHHERWDGAGYPDQLAGGEIPLAARVVGLVDVYEALRVRRPHRPQLPHSYALKIITEESPGHFDPVLLAAFVKAATRFEQIHVGE